MPENQRQLIEFQPSINLLIEQPGDLDDKLTKSSQQIAASCDEEANEH